MFREELQSRFHDPLLQPISSISPSASATKSLQWQVSQHQKNELLHDGPPLKRGSSVAARKWIMKSYVL